MKTPPKQKSSSVMSLSPAKSSSTSSGRGSNTAEETATANSNNSLKNTPSSNSASTSSKVNQGAVIINSSPCVCTEPCYMQMHACTHIDVHTRTHTHTPWLIVILV